MTTKRKIILTLVMMACIVFVAVMNQPWKQRAEQRLQAELESFGLKRVKVEVTSIQPNAVKLAKLSAGGMINAENIAVDLHSLEEGSLRGTWTVASFTIDGAPPAMMPLSGEGEFTAARKMFTSTIRALGPQDKLDLDAELQWNSANPDLSTLQIKKLVMKPDGGTWTLVPATLKLKEGEVWKLQVKVKQQPIAELLAALGATPLSATGEVEGTIPIEISRKKNSLVFKRAELKSKAAGVLKLAPETLPAQGTEVGMLRDLMSDFHFTSLVVAMNGATSNSAKAGEKLSINLRLEGSNPAVYDGKPIHLNINLQGDLASLLQQSLLPMLQPAQWIEEPAHDKKP